MKLFKSFLLISTILSSYAFSEILGEEDLPNITKCKAYEESFSSIKSCKKSVLILRKPKVQLKGKVTGYYNSSDYSVLWIKTKNNYQVGCLANGDSTKFDNINIGDNVLTKGSTHHIEKHSNQTNNSLLLTKGCTVEILK